ncbi:3-hydroxyacyl-CoA dehydrogenase [Oceanobacillus sojae]|uniref:3-hydroxyacyl-CoA dehydrogenase n=1 Tax=Oceanobacillus sojae TaxID=582851 RepID=UPI00098890B7|nr:3-hydroxyacyl-CoA dehydrogenase [Oceanobacillus sojae]MCT1902152.1 3-hydroxyacyl-CoA dehydrogenase [Oceanobacillus sojae]
MEFKNVTVAGSGVLGSQIAYQVSYKGFNVTVYDINAEAVEAAKTRMEKWQQRYKEDLNAADAEVKEAFERISFSIDLKEAVKDADLIIEAVPEKEEIKLDFYKKLAEVAPEKTIFASNSSTMLPSQFAEATGRPSQFLMLHFANEIWKNNTAEIMKHEGTDMKVFEDVVAFAKQIGMVALPIYKEQPGYILNSLLVPFLDAAQDLLVNEIADAETIDKTWMVATEAPKGPFAILDVIGIRTPYNLSAAHAEAGDKKAEKVASFLKEEYLDKGKFGIESGEGFYKYPDPAFENPDFLK